MLKDNVLPGPGEKHPDETALVPPLRLCGDGYKKRIDAAASIRARNVLEENRIETREKLKPGKDLETLSTASVR